MPSGDGFSTEQRNEIDRAIRAAETTCRYEFSVYVGGAVDQGSAREFAHRLHATLSSPDRSVLILVDPVGRALEIVTGADVRRDLSDDSVGLAAVRMQSAFAAGDFVGGLKHGVAQLADAARKPESLHTDH